MLHIDGSHGEGGGQILRTAIALSVVTQQEVTITHIRANRPTPGLKPQHHTVITIIQQLCNATTKGVAIGSSEITFTPGPVTGGRYHFTIGTAGSIVLVLQACILSFLRTSEPIHIKITGGTDVKWSPSWDYFTQVFLPLIKTMGVQVETTLYQRGYYPKGGGSAELILRPCHTLKPLRLREHQTFTSLQGRIHSAHLPDHVGKRIKHAALQSLVPTPFKPTITVEQTASLSPGTGITLWATSNDTVMGATALGKKGIPSEHLGTTAAQHLLAEITSGATLDVHGFDQLLPFMALAEGNSECYVRNLSGHAHTNMWLIAQFFNDTTMFLATQEGHLTRIKIVGKALPLG
jgi:RNA 3'-phosphate cyclase